MDTLLPEDRIEACKMFYNNFHRLPRVNEKMNYKGIEFKIGLFIVYVKRGIYNDDVVHEVNNVFKCDVLKPIVRRISDEQKIEACRKFFTRFARPPMYNEQIELEDGTTFKIGYFIQNVKCGSYTKLKPEVEQIFNQELKTNPIHFVPDDKKIEACKEFFNKFGKLPQLHETMIVKLDSGENVEFNIGLFVNRIKDDRCHNQQLIEEIQQIFGQNALYQGKHTQDREILNIIKEYKLLGLNTEKYKGINIRTILYRIRHCGTHKSIHDELIQFLNDYNHDKNKQIIDLIKRYITIYKCMPSADTTFEGINIYDLINSVKHVEVKREIEQLIQKH